MSSFSGLSGALSALHAQRRALEVAGNNIANANTEGYSRQRVTMQPIGAGAVPGLWSTSDVSNFGVRVDDVERLRDAFLESRGRTEHTQNAYLTSQKAAYKTIENVFAEPSDTALAAQLGEFWGAWADAANQPLEPAPRAALIQRGTIVADGLNGAYAALSAQWSAHRTQLDAYATEINTTATSLAALNESIQQAGDSGLPVNELVDERDLQIMRLAELTGATASVRSNGTVDVFLGGSTLVSGAVARQVEAAGATRLQDYDPDPTAAQHTRLRWTDASQATVAVGGTVGSSLETMGTTLPYYAGELDRVAAAVAATVNAEHVNAFSADGSTGLNFFTGTTAADLRVAISDPDKVGLGSVAGTAGVDIATRLSLSGSAAGSADEIYETMITDLGVAAEAVDRRAAIQQVMTADLDAARASTAGVNLDEEMTNMLTYQRGYEAASRVLTTIDAMLDQLINRTGLVGR
ncbi:MAG TPA: flagellar hook-associated protein FlgK [Actinoplanes sp.]|nr:flagellar hook-associated protein FlgK [Actinoplanes sp.]